MQPFLRSLYGIQRCVVGARSLPHQVSRSFNSTPKHQLSVLESDLLSSWRGLTLNVLQYPTSVAKHNVNMFLTYREFSASPSRITVPTRATTIGNSFPFRQMATVSQPVNAAIEDESVASSDTVQPQRIKFKRLDKTARHIMNILDKEEVEKVRGSREIPDIKPGYIVQLKVEVPENKRRVSVLKGIVIAKRNAGLQTTFRLRRMVAGVGVESVFPLYSPNIKEMKVLDKKDVRRAKLYYLRDRMNALKQK